MNAASSNRVVAIPIRPTSILLGFISPNFLTALAITFNAAAISIILAPACINGTLTPSNSFAAPTRTSIEPATPANPVIISPGFNLDNDLTAADNTSIAAANPTKAAAVVTSSPLPKNPPSKSPILPDEDLPLDITACNTANAPISSTNNAVKPLKAVFNPPSSIDANVDNDNANNVIAPATFNNAPALTSVVKALR